MSKPGVSEFASLDGVMEDPGKWSFEFPRSKTQMKFKTDELFASDALLLGRATCEGFASAWPSMQDDPAGYGKKMNDIPKYVVTGTLSKVEWKNSMLVKGDLVTEIKKLKAEIRRDILVFGSLKRSSQLLRHGLVDELRLMYFPVFLGGGRSLSKEAMMTGSKHAEAKIFDPNILLVTHIF